MKKNLFALMLTLVVIISFSGILVRAEGKEAKIEESPFKQVLTNMSDSSIIVYKKASLPYKLNIELNDGREVFYILGKTRPSRVTPTPAPTRAPSTSYEQLPMPTPEPPEFVDD